jgi:uncharacterized Fe-S cluster-containing protein
MAISQANEETKIRRNYTCPNAACGKVFTKPLRALNLQLGPKEFYDACPYCLTEITADDEKTEEPLLEEVKPPEKSSSCSHYVGYLSERSTKDVPDECMVCKDLLPCMLKNMKP